MSESIWFWQRIVSPHMMGLASALADKGIDVTYVAERPMSDARAAQGWQLPDTGAVKLLYAPDVRSMIDTARSAPKNSVHISQGLRGNGLITKAQKALADRRLRQWVVMETLDDTGWRGMARRLGYRRLIALRGRSLSGYLAIGHATPSWLIQQGADPTKVFPFTYFLSGPSDAGVPSPRGASFHILFVGQFVERKRLDLLIRAVAALERPDVVLNVIGSGSQGNVLREFGHELLGSRLHWIGRLPSTEVRRHMHAADLLVLPSRHDGWGAVVSEAIMAGTPVICSDKCGSAGVVWASRRGGVFQSGDLHALTDLLASLVDAGPQSYEQRRTLAQWGRGLGAKAGADYLTDILAYRDAGRERPTPPWKALESGT